MNMSKILNTVSIIKEAFGNKVELFPSVNELFELELAFMEFKSLDKEQLLERTAYIKSIDNIFSKHYLLYSTNSHKIHADRTSATQTYFEEGQYSTGYATHGLFPYRGKFHPQLIKGLINVLNIQRDEIILDPMAGSGTTNVEAALLSINSKAIDVSPFCQFMIQTKYDSLTIDLKLLNQLKIDSKKLFDFFIQGDVLSRLDKIGDNNKIKIYNFHVSKD